MTDKRTGLIERLQAKNYPLKLSFDEQDQHHVAEFLDLPGCVAYGQTVEEAFQNAQEAKRNWFLVSLEQGLPIPEPSTYQELSGRILLRVPTCLHSMVSMRAKMFGASLNQYLVHLLSAAVVNDSFKHQFDELHTKLCTLDWKMSELKTLQLASNQREAVTTGIRPVGNLDLLDQSSGLRSSKSPLAA